MALAVNMPRAYLLRYLSAVPACGLALSVCHLSAQGLLLSGAGMLGPASAGGAADQGAPDQVGTTASAAGLQKLLFLLMHTTQRQC